MSSEEKRRILFDWNQTASDYPADKCVHQLIEAQAQRTPDAIAIQHGQQKVTYREFNERANQLAHYLRTLGVGPDVPVGICLPSSISLAVCFLAVLKANGACLPLDPAYPKDRLQFMVQDARIPVLLSNETLSADLAGSDVKVVCVDSAWQSIARESRSNPENGATTENLAYLIYTSGSTGKPKGVMLPHRGLVNYITAVVKLYGLTAGDRQVQFSSISFDIAIEEMYPTWTAGATLILRSDDFSLAGPEFLHWARQQKLTLMTMATAYWHELVHELSENGTALPESLRLVVVGGEKAQIPALEAWRKVAGGRVRWINTYGPTEASVIATSYELPSSGPPPSPLPIGRPVSNTRIYILDENLQPVPVGESGELHIGGDGLARGYLNAPDMTASKFIRDPFSLDPSARLYKTGDLARYLPDGQIEFVGRRDFQVKIRGFRVEPGEIEAVLMRHESIRQAIVMVQEDRNGKRLVGYLVAGAGKSIRGADVRKYLKGELPDYMVPAAFVFVEELPLTPNGKVDRRALKALPIDETPAEDYAAPADETELKLARMWEELLGKKPIGTHDNFFELGGHSLLAVRLMRQIEQTFNRKLPLVTLFEAPTIAQLAAILRKDNWASSFSLAIPIQPLGNRPPFFCVHGLGGAVLRFKDLARHMAPDQPFYGIQPPGMDGEAPLLHSVEEMAARYIIEMKKVQAEGPYYIGGYSFGGLVAFEMARQLESAGEEVAFLGLLDTYPGRPKTTSMLLGTLMKLPREAQVAYVRRKLTKYRRGLRRRFDSLFLPKALKEVRNVLAQAEMEYRPQTYMGSATWLRASEKTLRGTDNPQDDWSNWVAGGVEIVEIDGDHGSIMNEPTVAVFADTLRNCLAKAQERYSERAAVTV